MLLPYIQAMPAPAMTMAIQVRGNTRWPSMKRASKAVNKGPRLMVMSTLATVVSVKATMKQVNITLHITPEIHNGLPPVVRMRGASRPCSVTKYAARDKARKKLRQKVISKACAESSMRVMNPAMLHIKVTASMPATARRWEMEEDVTTVRDGAAGWCVSVPATGKSGFRRRDTVGLFCRVG